MPELICPTHGPYNAALGACPFCNSTGNRPQPPSPLENDDNMPTQIKYGGAGYNSSDDDAPTELPGQMKAAGGHRRILDMDDDEATSLGMLGRDMLDRTELANKPAEAIAILWVKEGNRRGKIYKISGDTVIGRREGDLIIDDSKVSNPHAKITCADGQFTLWDFGSKNGTFINGERIRAATTLKENDLVKMGDMVFVFKVLDATAPEK